MVKAYGYIRCSGLGQMDGDGPIRQRAAIEQFATVNGYEIADWFEESHTGSDLDGRPKFRDMRALLVSDGVRVVIVEKLDRLARSIMVQETILADFKKQGIELLSATAGEDGLCSDDPTRVLMRQILACFFEYERKMIVSKLRAARDRKRKLGRCEGRIPFGQHPDYPQEIETLRFIMYLHQSDKSPQSIARKLNDKGLRARRGGPWYPSSVDKILRRAHNEVLNW